jgi:hypothetical protein
LLGRQNDPIGDLSREIRNLFIWPDFCISFLFHLMNSIAICINVDSLTPPSSYNVPDAMIYILFYFYRNTHLIVPSTWRNIRVFT